MVLHLSILGKSAELWRQGWDIFFAIHGLDYGIRLPCSPPCTKPRTWLLVSKLGGMVTVSFPILYGGAPDHPSWRGEKLAKLRVAYCDKGRWLYIREHELLIYTRGEKEDIAKRGLTWARSWGDSGRQESPPNPGQEARCWSTPTVNFAGCKGQQGGQWTTVGIGASRDTSWILEPL